MRKSATLIAALATVTLIGLSPASAQFGLPNIPGAGAIPGLGGGGGSGFSAAAASLATNLKTALYNQVMAIALIQEAQGDKVKAGRLRATAAAMQAMKQPSKDQMEKSLKAVEENPVNREGLAKVKDAEGQKKISQASAHMSVVLVYDGLAIASATAMLAQKPGPSDIANAPAILETAQLALTSLPTQTANFQKYNEMTEAYMKENNVAKPTAAEKQAIAKKTDPAAKAIGAGL
ncbi:MAG: hypothetical protein NTZ22_14225 [Hyphomicrobiales bacterium]|jgi:hypothetical protein|nr:hypothetical protein [Hyphomicrobiales bacterium]